VALDSRVTETNDVLNEVLLSGRFAGRPFYFSLDQSARTDVAQALGLPASHVEDHVVAIVGQALRRQGNPYGPHLSNAQHWWQFDRRKSKPPFTALLLAFSHIASQMAPDEDFGAGNYYGRLSEAFRVSRNAVSFNGASTEYLWLAFNGWLALNDFEFGRPTAKPFNTWRYVNYPQSQAIVRAGDRHLFHAMFERYGLTGAEGMGVEEIKHYLAHWVPTSESNARLKAAWSKTELRNRFCEVVLAELEDWGGARSASKHGEGEAQTLRLALLATLTPQFPRPRISLELGRPGSAGLTQATFKSRIDGNGYALGHEVFGSALTLSPNPIYQSPTTLADGFEGEAGKGGLRTKWRPRLVMPLARSPDGPYWTEAPRASIGAEHIVLVRGVARVTALVDEYLAEASDLQSSVARPADLPGLPPGWLAYLNVRIIKRGVPARHEDVESLAALESAASDILASEGLRLSNGIWHAHKPPSLSFLAAKPPARLEIRPADSENQPPLFASLSDTVDAAIPPSRWPEECEGEYEITAYSGDKIAAEQSLVLRSASSPRPPEVQARTGLGYFTCPVSASFPDEALGAGGPSALELGVVATAAAQSRIPESAGDEAPALPPSPTETPAASEACVSRGYHVWRLETVPPDYPRYAPVNGVCAGCGESILVNRKRKKQRTKAVRTASARPVTRKWVAPSESESLVEHDLVVDALCYFGSGSFSRLEAILANMVTEAWQASELASAYCALGLLDLALVPGSGRVATWRVAPASVMFTGEKQAFFTGFRSKQLIAEVIEAVRAAGGVAQVIPYKERPSAVRFSGLTASTVAGALVGCVDPFGRPVAVVATAGPAVAAAAFALGPVMGVMAPVAIATADVKQVFDCNDAKWRTPERSPSHGGLRLGWAGTTYAYKAPTGKAWAGPHQLVKLAAARSEGKRLHAYDDASLQFLSARGAEPLGLLGRALVACSGELPSFEGGLLRYKGVPSDVGRLVLSKLYEEGERS
jgi:hypothetical protein